MKNSLKKFVTRTLNIAAVTFLAVVSTQGPVQAARGGEGIASFCTTANPDDVTLSATFSCLQSGCGALHGVNTQQDFACRQHGIKSIQRQLRKKALKLRLQTDDTVIYASLDE